MIFRTLSPPDAQKTLIGPTASTLPCRPDKRLLRLRGKAAAEVLDGLLNKPLCSVTATSEFFRTSLSMPECPDSNWWLYNSNRLPYLRNPMTLFPRILSIALLFCASMFMVIQDAEAKRFGGGRSMGRSAHYSRPATPTRSTTRSTQGNRSNNQQRSGMGRFMGPLAGLAAGGLLAAMFMGGGFEGIQFFDIIIIALLVFGGLWLFRRMRAGGGAQRQRYAAGAGAGSGTGGNPSGFQVPDIGSGVGGGNAESATGLSQKAPPWFDVAGFLKGAKQQFMTMQKAWDNRDLKKIAETVTPDMYKELKQEIDSMGENHTEVVTINTELLGFSYEPNLIIVHVRMTGLIREQADAQPAPFDEVWLVQRATNTQQANWYVAGIQQNG